LIGTAVGAAVGYILGTDKDKRDEQIEKLKDSVSKLKNLSYTFDRNSSRRSSRLHPRNG